LPSPGEHSVSLWTRVYTTAEIDDIKRLFGQVKDLAHGPQDPEVRACVMVLHGQGHGPCHIARETGLSRKQVARLLKSEGFTREPCRPASARLPEILELRRQGYGFAAIGRRLGYSRNAVRRAVRAHQG
jgi:DNA-binding NarL/FixJ family response regulator